MTLGESLVAGLGEVRNHKLRTVLQTLGVILGVASLVAVQGLVDAGRRQTVKFFAEVGGLNKILVVNRPPKERVETARQLASVGLTLDDAEAIKREITAAALVDPVSETWQRVRAGDYQETNEITGATPDYADVYKFRAARGRFLSQDDMAKGAPVCVLGDTAARRYFGAQDPLGKTLSIGDTGFVVVGVMVRKEFSFGEGDSDNALEWMNRMTFIPLTTLYARFTGDTDRRVGFINIVVGQTKDQPKAVEAVRGLILRRHAGVVDFEVYNRRERMRQHEERNRVFDITFLVAGIVSLIVGGVVIMNIMLASFQERMREVGVRKAIGARPLDIGIQFLMEAILVTVLGGAVGLVLGIGFAQGITALLKMPAIITAKMALVGVSASVSVGLFFGLYPAFKAARLHPVEALRYE